VTYAREVFASHPDDCIVIRITTDKPTTIKADLFLEPGQNIIEPVPQTSDTLLFGGSLSNGLKYSAKVVSISGTVSKNAKKPQTTRFTTSGEKLEFRLFAATDYAMDPAKNFRSKKSAWDKVEEQVEKASSKNYQKLRADHVADFNKLLGGVELSLGAPPEGLSLPQRLKRYRTGEMDAHLEMLLFQYGRYLLISSSRNSLPANLQGLWNDMNHPAWYCDYHTNINIQMNYWPVEVANLSECAMPLFNWIEASIPGSRAATKKEAAQNFVCKLV
jgi:alpha-L-fucosidase 2